MKGVPQQLAELMLKISIEFYQTEWLLGLEYELWREIHKKDCEFGRDYAAKLKELSEWCEGWIYMKYEKGEESLKYIQMSAWQKRYRENKPF